MGSIREIQRLNEIELEHAGQYSSWHDDYRDSAYIFVGGFPFELTEGDLLTIFAQYGEIEDINLIRDQKTGKSKGFCFIKYQDERSCVLAIDNFNGIKILDRLIKVDHSKFYREPEKKDDKDEEEKKRIKETFLAPPAPPKKENESKEPKDRKKKKKRTEEEMYQLALQFKIDPEDPMRDYLIKKKLKKNKD